MKILVTVVPRLSIAVKLDFSKRVIPEEDGENSIWPLELPSAGSFNVPSHYVRFPDIQSPSQYPMYMLSLTPWTNLVRYENSASNRIASLFLTSTQSLTSRESRPRRRCYPMGNPLKVYGILDTFFY